MAGVAPCANVLQAPQQQEQQAQQQKHLDRSHAAGHGWEATHQQQRAETCPPSWLCHPECPVGTSARVFRARWARGGPWQQYNQAGPWASSSTVCGMYSHAGQPTHAVLRVRVQQCTNSSYLVWAFEVVTWRRPLCWQCAISCPCHKHHHAVASRWPGRSPGSGWVSHCALHRCCAAARREVNVGPQAVAGQLSSGRASSTGAAPRLLGACWADWRHLAVCWGA